MRFISVASAINLTTWSESTMRRRISEGAVIRVPEVGSNGRAMVDFASVLPHIEIPLDQSDFAMIEAADAGEAEAQTDLALTFLLANNAKGAVYWLELAVKQNHAGAMYHLGRCYTDGAGVARNENMGLIWILKAAEQGNVIAATQMQHARDKLAGRCE